MKRESGGLLHFDIAPLLLYEDIIRGSTIQNPGDSKYVRPTKAVQRKLLQYLSMDGDIEEFKERDAVEQYGLNCFGITWSRRLRFASIPSSRRNS